MALSKTGVIKELSTATNLPKTDVARLLKALAELAYQEAANGFTIPDICRIKIVRRKSTRRWNPQMKKYVLISEHASLKITPLAKAKRFIIPEKALTQVLPDEAPRLPAEKPAAAPQPPAPPPVSNPAYAAPTAPAVDEQGNIVFTCPHCNNLVMADAKYAGMAGICPMCNANIEIPKQSEAAPENEAGIITESCPTADRSAMTLRMDVKDFLRQ